MRARLDRKGDDLVLAVSADDIRSLGLTVGPDVEIRPTPIVSASAPARRHVKARRHVNGFPVYNMAEMAAEMRRLGPDSEPPTVDWGPDVGSEIINDDDRT